MSDKGFDNQEDVRGSVQRAKGLVYRSTGNLADVKDLETGQMYSCKVRGKLRLKGIRTTNPVSVGDKVVFSAEDKDDTGVIEKIEERENYIIRKSVKLSKQAHIIAANVDRALLMVTPVAPTTHSMFIDRFLVSAEAYHIPVTLLFNKMDLFEGDDEQTTMAREMIGYQMDMYRDVGYDVLSISATSGMGLEQVWERVEDNTVVIAGLSGSGKSSLLKLLAPGLDIRIGDISEVHMQGKHTTTFAEMFDLDRGARFIDTPGIRGFGLIDIDKEELAHYFPEMRALRNECYYSNCVHVNEPKCAVKQALEDGRIPEERYMNYLSMYHGEEDNYRANIYGQ